MISLRSFPLSAVLGLAAVALLPGTSSAAFFSVWQVGVDNGTNTEFGQESGSSNAAPGSAATKDDDWYFAGTYPLPIGTLAADEASANFERALTLGDPTDRIHFNLPAGSFADGTEFRLTIDTVSNNSSVPTSPIPFTVFFNGVQVFSGSVNAVAQLFTTPSFFVGTGAGQVSASTGDNVVTITRSTSTGAGWMQFDYVRLETQTVPEPSTAAALAGSIALLLGSRRRRR